VLIVHLQRILFNYDTFQNEKINSKLEFPNSLSLEPYTEEGLALREAAEEKKKKKRKGKEDKVKVEGEVDMDIPKLKAESSAKREEEQGKQIEEQPKPKEAQETRAQEQPQEEDEDEDFDDEEEEEQNDKPQKEEQKLPEDKYHGKGKHYYEYKLVGVVVHWGTADAGHYYSYINTDRNSNQIYQIYQTFFFR
jgi:hypothetical protein